MSKPKNPLTVPIGFLLMVLALLAVSLSLLFYEQNRTLVKRRELLSLKRDLQKLDQILVDRKTYQPQLDKVTQTVPATPQEVAVALSQFEGLAKTSGVAYDAKLEDGANSEPEGVRSIKMTLTLSGSYVSLTGWFTNVAKLAYHTKIDSIVFEGGKGPIQVTIAMRLFVQ